MFFPLCRTLMWIALSYLLTHMLKSLAIFVHFKWGFSLKSCPILPEIFDLSIRKHKRNVAFMLLYIDYFLCKTFKQLYTSSCLYIIWRSGLHTHYRKSICTSFLFFDWFLFFAMLEPQICCGVQCQTPRGHEWNHFTHAGSCPGTYDPRDT